MKLHFVTSNAAKVQTMQQFVADKGIVIEQIDLPLIEPQADDIESISRSKAEQAFDQLGKPVVIEDAGFFIDALNGFPGPYAKYANQTIGAEGILKLMTGIEERSCYFKSVLAFADAQGQVHLFQQPINIGQLAIEPVANSDDAWSDLWRIYIPAGSDRPLAAIDGKDRDALFARWKEKSHFQQLANWLIQQQVA